MQIKVCSNHSPYGSGGAAMGKTIFTCDILTKIFSRNSRLISMKLGTFPWVKGILNSSNLGAGPLQRGENHKNTKMGWGHSKIFFSRTKELEELVL
jgi:hypothetical protein